MISLLDPSIWISIFALIFVEIFLNINNIGFISLLIQKLPHQEKNKAQYFGLIVALLMRFSLLITSSWLVNLTKTTLINKFFIFSTKEIILFFGGFFLFSETIDELYAYMYDVEKNKKYSRFWYVAAQLIILDAVFFINSVTIETGITNNLLIKMLSITVSPIILILLAQLFIKYMGSQKKTSASCLCYLLIISLNLILESLGFFIPKEYLYIPMGFTLFIETMHQIRKNNLQNKKFQQPLPTQIINTTLNVIYKNIKNNKHYKKNNYIIKQINYSHDDIYNYTDINAILTSEINIITNASQLGNKSIQEIMIPKKKIIWINIFDNKQLIKKIISNYSYQVIPVCQDTLNNMIGMVPIKALLDAVHENKNLYDIAIQYPPIIIPNTLKVITLLNFLRYAENNIILISDESGVIQGSVTPMNVFNMFIGTFLSVTTMPQIILNENHWIAYGSINLNSLEKILQININKKYDGCISLADFLIYKNKNIPKSGEVICYQSYNFHILKSNLYQIHLVKITKEKNNNICMLESKI
ncbi:TerC family protein [Buchnera aphidicola]|uniref:TerC family protein n=1 Tax=Buchnera aphidicola TaxID=9 RepID=UPI00094D4109|nr:transporter associated domain-containing protein [Buchnera aphidicola]